MFFLGHMCWAYAFGKSTSRLTSGKVKVQLLLLCGVLPDVDLFLGVEHGGAVHSVAFWIVAFVPVLLLIGPKRGLPCLASTLQHLLFGDMVAAKYKILVPFSDTGFGFGLGLLSTISLSLELLGFFAFIMLAHFSGELRALFRKDPENLLSLLPAVAMLASIESALWMGGLGTVAFCFEAAQVSFLLLLLYSSLMGAAGKMPIASREGGFQSGRGSK
ncbi:MAG: hypothetical protein JTT11_01220 [Candidatus Brockarchaeota archaeon]|nr:hypothetical protein [Candidatus Brockarchaeota archaeon]